MKKEGEGSSRKDFDIRTDKILETTFLIPKKNYVRHLNKSIIQTLTQNLRQQ